MRVVFLGTADFGIPVLQKLVDASFDVAGIVTMPPRPRGRGLKDEESPVARYAGENGFKPVYTPENLKDQQFLTAITALRADIFIVVAYRILPDELFSLPRFGTMNIHASLLPKYRGSAPIQRAIEHGETETGVTLFQIDKGVDTGRIVLQKRLSIGSDETAPELYERLSRLGADACIEACAMVQQGNFTGLAQDSADATSAPKLRKEEALIDWTLPAAAIFNKIRAFKPFPGTWTMLNGKRLGIEWAVPADSASSVECGTVLEVSNDWFEVQCRNSSLRILRVKPEAKKIMDVQAFLNGHTIEKGMNLH